MERAIQYTEYMNSFVGSLLKHNQSVEVNKGRRYDKVRVDNTVTFFVDKERWTIYGAKSPAQHNVRRTYGTLATHNEYDWASRQPLPNTPSAASHEALENSIKATYKKRGRPRKVNP
jgi:hypothetical protein